MAEAFSYRRAEQTVEVFHRHGVRYMFIGKSAAIVLGFPDATQDADIFVKKSPENCAALATALADLGFPLTEQQKAEILRGKDFIQIKNGPFLLDVIFAPDGIDSFEKADARAVEVEGIRVAHLDDIIRSKEKATDPMLPRLRAFREWWKQRNR